MLYKDPNNRKWIGPSNIIRTKGGKLKVIHEGYEMPLVKEGKDAGRIVEEENNMKRPEDGSNEDGEKYEEEQRKNDGQKIGKEDKLDARAIIRDEENDMLISIVTSCTDMGKENIYAMTRKDKDKRKYQTEIGGESEKEDEHETKGKETVRKQ